MQTVYIVQVQGWGDAPRNNPIKNMLLTPRHFSLIIHTYTKKEIQNDTTRI